MNEWSNYKYNKYSKKQEKEIVNKYKETVSLLKFCTKVLHYLNDEYLILASNYDNITMGIINGIINDCFDSKENIPNTANKVYIFLKDR